MKNELLKKLDCWIEAEKRSRAAIYFGCESQKKIYETAKNILNQIQNFDNIKLELDALIKSKDHSDLLDEINTDDFSDFQEQAEIVLQKNHLKGIFDEDYAITARACNKILEFA